MRRVWISAVISMTLIGCSDNLGASESKDFQEVEGQRVDDEVMARIGGAAEIVSILEQHGEVMSDKRPVELFFYGDEEALTGLSNDPALAAYDLRKIDDPLGIAASQDAIVDDEWVVRTAHDMVMAARKYGVEYDGWEAGLVRQGGQ